MYQSVKKIKGTDAYQKLKKNNLTAMVDCKRLPAVFNTFSYADTHWDDLKRLLDK